MKKIFIPLLMLVVITTSCVSLKKFNSEKARALYYENEAGRLTKHGESLETNIASLDKQIEDLYVLQHSLQKDTTALGTKIRDLTVRYNRLLADGSAEAARMLRQIQDNQSALAERERKVEELNVLLSERERAINEIRRQVTDALLGFEGKGLTVTQKGGNVYVSMDEKLLFKSGSFDIDPIGAQAVRDLAGVLAKNPDIVVMIEGHTDDVPYRPNGNLQDNLDLSAKRATTVTRLLLENKGIDPSRVIAGGRGESVPIDGAKTAEARQRNRRTEIVLTPKLDKLMELTESAY